jgi:hypothetical protein
MLGISTYGNNSKFFVTFWVLVHTAPKLFSSGISVIENTPHLLVSLQLHHIKSDITPVYACHTRKCWQSFFHFSEIFFTDFLEGWWHKIVTFLSCLETVPIYSFCTIETYLFKLCVNKKT